MPEGDTIFRAARALNRALAGQRVVGFETGYALLARVDDDAPLIGRVVEKVESRGKWMMMYFSGDLILVTHMLMNGTWHMYRHGERWQRPRGQMRIWLKTEPQTELQAGSGPQAGSGTAISEDGSNQTVEIEHESKADSNAGSKSGSRGWEAVAFVVPVAEFHTAKTLARHRMIPALGPDLLAPGYDVAGGAAKLAEYGSAHPDAEIANVLLNQRVLAGVGNVYKSEICFATAVHPFRSMSSLTPAERENISQVALKYMTANVKDGAQDGIVTYTGFRRTTGASNPGDRLWVYGRQGQECRRCGATILMRKQGAGARSTYWCPECQPGADVEGWNRPLARKKVGCG